MSANRERNVVLTANALRTLRATLLKQAESLALWHLVSALPPAGDVVSNASLGRELLIKDNRISPAMKRLCELGYLMRGPKVGISYFYKLNPAFFRILS